MALFEKKQPLGQGGQEKKDTSGFGGKPYLRRDEFRQWLRRPELFSSTNIPESERVSLERDFGQDYGPFINREDVQRILSKLGKAKSGAPNSVERIKIERKIKLLNKFLGR
jgi:hypothetical protein